MALFEYLGSGNVHPIWLDNLVSFHARTDIAGMAGFVDELAEPVLFLQLYQAACRYSSAHDKFYLTAQQHLLDAPKPVLSVLRHLVSNKEYDYSNPLCMDALRVGSESFDAETEKAAVLLAVALLEQGDRRVEALVALIVKSQAGRHPNATDYRRLCFVQQLSMETGLMADEAEAISKLLPPRSKYSCFTLGDSHMTLEDIIQEIPHYDCAKHECVHECYHD